jgi:nucleoside-diphosphate-sugar epimerase
VSKVLVTGGAGYVGSILVRRLLEEGRETVVLDNFSYGRDALSEVERHPKLDLVEGDICDIKDVSRALRGVSRVVALAAIVGDPAAALDEEATYSVNYEATKVLVELCNRAGVERLVFASSCSVYGAHPELVLNEGSRLNPQSLYAITRIMSEDTIRARSEKRTCPVILRLASLYGWSHRPRFDLAVNMMSAKAATAGEFTIVGGSQWRPFLHVADAAEAFLVFTFAPAELVCGETFNVGRNEGNHTIAQVGDAVARAYPRARRDERSGGADRRDYRVSFDKLAACLPELRMSRTMDDGVREIGAMLERTGVDYREDRYYNVEYLFK